MRLPCVCVRVPPLFGGGVSVRCVRWSPLLLEEVSLFGVCALEPSPFGGGVSVRCAWYRCLVAVGLFVGALVPIQHDIWG